MYLIFYLAALFRLHTIQGIADSFLPLWGATALAGAVMVTAGAGIPLRCYLMSAVGFDYQRLGEKFLQMFPFILALDQLWAVAPFLLIQKIGLGAAFAASAALLYLPFSERTLVRMAYAVPRRKLARAFRWNQSHQSFVIPSKRLGRGACPPEESMKPAR